MMDWLSLLHALCLLPTLGLIFGTSCCCELPCVTCVGGSTYALCSDNAVTITVTLEGIANDTCTACDLFDGVYVFDGSSGSKSIGSFEYCTGAPASATMQVTAGVNCGNPTAHFINSQAIFGFTSGPIHRQFAAGTTLSTYSSLTEACSEIPGIHVANYGAFSTSNGQPWPCDFSSATATIEVNGP